MKGTFIRASLLFVCLAELSTSPILTRAESHCPASVPTLHPRLVAGALLVVPVIVNGTGPFDFIVDTGSQLNAVDPLLASELNLKSQARIGLIATASVQQASVGSLDSLQLGPHRLLRPIAAIQDLAPIQAVDPRIRGVLGENFLGHYDLLIDYPQGLLCLDERGVMEKQFRGVRIPFVTSTERANVPFSRRLVISVSLSGTGAQPVFLQIDSGSDGAVLFASNKETERSLLQQAKLQEPGVGQARRAFAVLPPQDLKIGSRTIHQVLFVTPSRASARNIDREEDGVLATVLFRSVFISHSKNFISFDLR